jgi:hypothetical protein
VELPRFRIAWAMVLVAAIALELGAIRALSAMQLQANIEGSHHLSLMIGALALGAIPMANVLAVGLLIGLCRRGRRQFLWGFETFGAMTLALYIAGVILLTEELVRPLFDLTVKHLFTGLWNGPYRNNVGHLIGYSVTIAILAIPQVAFALIGGFLFRYSEYLSDRPPRCERIPASQFPARALRQLGATRPCNVIADCLASIVTVLETVIWFLTVILLASILASRVAFTFEGKRGSRNWTSSRHCLIGSLAVVNE